MRRLQRRGYLAAMPRIDDVPIGNSGEVSISLDRNLLTRLRPAAKARDTTVAQLCRDLLEAIARDRLADAVLDDQARADSRER